MDLDYSMDSSTRCSTSATSQLCLHSCNDHNQHSYSLPHDQADILEEDDRHTLKSGSSTFTFVPEVPTPLCMSRVPTISQEQFDENNWVEMMSPAILERSVYSQCFDPSYVATGFQHDREISLSFAKHEPPQNHYHGPCSKTLIKLPNLML